MKLKSNKFYIAILAITTVFASCSKDQNKTDIQFTNKQDETTLKLLSFKQDLFSKSGGSMPSDSAEWHLEGLLNYEQANNTHEFTEVEFNRDTLLWPAENGEISYQDMQNLYAAINEMAEDMAIQNGNPEYTLDIIDLQIVKTGFKSNEQSVEVTLSGGTKGTTPTHASFGPDDYWFSAGLQGKCGDFTGQYLGRDATTELEKQFMNPKTIPSYYVSIESGYAHAPDYPTHDNPYGNFMIWERSGYISDNYCLSPDELNYYVSKFNYIEYTRRPAGKTFKTVDVIYDFYVPTGLLGSEFYTYELYYGVKSGYPTN